MTGKLHNAEKPNPRSLDSSYQASMTRNASLICMPGTDMEML